MVVTFLFELGEACSDEIQKAHCGALGPLVGMLMEATIPSADHQLVSVVVLEVYVRYTKVLSGHQQVIAGVAATFVDTRGIQHPVEVCICLHQLQSKLVRCVLPFADIKPSCCPVWWAK